MHTVRTMLRVIGAGALLAVASTATTWAAGTGYLFVSSEKDHAVSVLDGESYALVKQIRTAARPRHLQFTPDRSRIYVACGDGDAIDVIDVARLELVDRIGPSATRRRSSSAPTARPSTSRWRTTRSSGS